MTRLETGSKLWTMNNIMTSISLELLLPYIVVLIAGVFLLLAYRKRRVDRSFYGFAWLPAIFQIFTRHNSLFDDDGPRKRCGPDMAYSAGRDPAHQNTRLRQVFIPMHPDHDATLRQFYLTELGLMEMRAPQGHLNQDGF